MVRGSYEKMGLPPSCQSKNIAFSCCCVNKTHRLNMEIDLQSIFGLHVTWCAQLFSLAETPQLPPSPCIWTRITRALLVSKDWRHLFVTPWQDLSDKIATRDVVRVLGDELRARTVDITNCLSQVSSLPLTPVTFCLLLWTTVNVVFRSVLDPGSGAFLTPGTGIWDVKKIWIRIRDEHPRSYRELRNSFLG